MKKYLDFMAKYYPGRRQGFEPFNTYGYSTTQLLVHVLKQCGDNLTRENVHEAGHHPEERRSST